ncbi:MAG: MFS transporter [Flavobacteriaceae bacterium]|nr:MFS transporter [Flavobacteriaceae bacterium]
MLQKGDKKLINAWAFYDWANSVYPLVITTAVFPLYFGGVTGGENAQVFFLGTQWTNTVLYTYVLSFSFLIVAFLSPILSSIADYMGNKKRFLQFFLYLGSLSVMSLYFFESKETLWVGILFSILASIGFWGSIVFYNAFLLEVAYPQDHDRVSAKGFMFGYFGSVFLLLFILTMIMHPEWYGFIDHPLQEGETAPGIAFRLGFVIVGIWWMAFAQYTLYHLPLNVHHRKPEKDYIFKGYRELRTVLKQLKSLDALKIFLISFFLFSAGVQTIIVLAGKFGDEELHLPTSNLIITILLVQLVAIVGAYVFSRISTRFGNILTLKITLIIWAIVCLAAYLLPGEHPNVNLYFYTLGGFLGLVLGATQTIARSTYAKLIPEDTIDTATYFSFFDVTEKLAIVLGTATFGLLVSLTGSMRISVLVLMIFFVAGFIVLNFMKKTKYVS